MTETTSFFKRYFGCIYVLIHDANRICNLNIGECNGGDGEGSLQKTGTCSTSFSKKNGHMPKILSQNQHLTKEMETNTERWGNNRWMWWEKLGEGDRHGAKVVTSGDQEELLQTNIIPLLHPT